MEEQAVKILLVDDRKEELLALQLILKEENYNFIHAATGRDALRILLKEQDFAIILMDVKMPIMDGFETATLIRNSERLKHIPIIFLTANDNATSDIFKGYMTGAVDYIIKPVAPEIIKAKVQVFTDLYKKTNELQSQHRNLLMLNNKYETLLKTQSEMGQGVMITEKGKIIYLNDAICKMLGYRCEEALQLPAFIPEEQNDGEMKLKRRDGAMIDIEFMSRNIEVGGKHQRLSIIRDITQKKHDEEQLRNEKERAESAEIAKKVGEQFLANMSHEIRTPMNAIIGFTNIMLKTPLTDEQKKYLDAIKTSGDNLLVIINDILDLSRIKSGKMQLELRPFKLSKIVTLSTELMLPKAMEKGIKLSFQIDKEIHDDLIGDSTRLSQVLLNLIANAIKFTHEGEVIVNAKLLSDETDETEIEFAVIDTGIGIAKDKLDSIFEAFKQAENNISRQYGGTGLGLAIVKELAELQNASITVLSEEGKGSHFSFRIKYKKASDAVTENSTIPEIPVKDIKKLNILLVEDNEMNQILAVKVLNDWGWEVEIAGNGIEAIEKFKRKDFDLILMDIQLPKMDGYEATHQIRYLMPSPKCNVPILAMTAHVMASEEEKCYNAGMDGYISKPFDVQTLYSKIYSVTAKTTLNGEKTMKPINGSVTA